MKPRIPSAAAVTLAMALGNGNIFPNAGAKEEKKSKYTDGELALIRECKTKKERKAAVREIYAQRLSFNSQVSE